MFKQATLIISQHYFIKNMMKSDPVITYNHMDDDETNRKMKHLKNTMSGKMLYITEVLIIAALLALMFIMF